MTNLSRAVKAARNWIEKKSAVWALSRASRGALGTNIEGSANYYRMMRNLRSTFNYAPNLNKYPYIYRGFSGKIYTPRTPTPNNIRLKRNPGRNSRNFALKNINKRMGWSSWSFKPHIAGGFGAGGVVLRMPTSFIKNVKVGNLTRTGEAELILPPMIVNFNANTNSKTANVTNIKVNGRYVREGSRVKTFIGREVAYKFGKS